MNIVCVICRDLLLPSEDIFHTPCGHVFHLPCLSQWLERSKTCPQCREKVTSAKIHRLYFNHSSNDSVTEDSTTLQSRVESLEFKLLLKQKDINHYISKAETAEKQVHGLRKETMRLENEIAIKNTANFALNEQVKLLWENNKIMEEQKKEIEKLRKQVELNRNVQTLLNSSYDSVDEMIKETRDPQTFITYIKVLKQELLCCTNKRKDQRTMIKNLHQDVSSLTKERNTLAEELVKRKHLEEQLAISESKRLEAERKLKALGVEVCVSNKNDDSVIETPARPPKESLLRLPDDLDDAPVAKKSKPSTKTQNLLGSPIVISEDSSDEGGIVVNLTGDAKENEKSPYLRLKSKGMSALKELHAQRSSVGPSHSIFSKKRLLGASSTKKGFGTVSFDGFGGHSQAEMFPIMNHLKQKKITSQDAVKAKKSKVDDGGNQKLGDFLINLV